MVSPLPESMGYRARVTPCRLRHHDKEGSNDTSRWSVASVQSRSAAGVASGPARRDGALVCAQRRASAGRWARSDVPATWDVVAAFAARYVVAAVHIVPIVPILAARDVIHVLAARHILHVAAARAPRPRRIGAARRAREPTAGRRRRAADITDGVRGETSRSAASRPRGEGARAFRS